MKIIQKQEWEKDDEPETNEDTNDAVYIFNQQLYGWTIRLAKIDMVVMFIYPSIFVTQKRYSFSEIYLLKQY